jgi:hypothetical protein
MKSTKSFFVVIGLLCATTVSAHFEDSPYAYCSGNPINAIDPDGCQVKIINGRSNSDNYMDLMNITENPSIVEISAPDNTKFSFEYKGAISKMHDCSNICDSLLSVYVEDKVPISVKKQQRNIQLQLNITESI